LAITMPASEVVHSAGHQRVWPLVEKAIKSQKDYPVVLYDEV
jgi:hypothetical protein